ncbi:TPA: terminase small subunit [Vibrio parahaemolyticus]|nr:terminase small subunit [Vibrio parahaemolyticus]HCE2322289.1 terminase small subunit [Vibrio parahaemolyticus]HCE2338228.1 terminase small subunit [Vibrio parahaemolyticus]HCE2353959.1 terminase small subunit [Vibrio parahaemolyticus]HCE2359071.1 terminase small subunit [Vibrio parahaemolyticus]
MKLLGQKQVADVFGVRPNTVKEWSSQGLPHCGETGSLKVYDSGEVYRWLVERAKNGVKKSTGKSLDYNYEKAREMKAKADKTEIEVAKMQGELLPADTVSDALSRSLAAVGGSLDSLPLQIKRRLPELTKRQIDGIEKLLAKTRNQLADEVPGKVTGELADV